MNGFEDIKKIIGSLTQGVALTFNHLEIILKEAQLSVFARGKMIVVKDIEATITLCKRFASRQNFVIGKPGAAEVHRSQMSDILLANRKAYKMVSNFSGDP